MRFMVIKDGSWMDFKKNATDMLDSYYVSGEAMIEMEMEGCHLIFDFH